MKSNKQKVKGNASISLEKKIAKSKKVIKEAFEKYGEKMSIFW